MTEKQFDYAESLGKTLKKARKAHFTALDLFAGCGGLALGFESEGFRTVGYEMDRDAAETYSRNLDGECHEVFLTPDFDFPSADIIIGGPPCQPFSVGGHQLGLKDSRDGFPAFIAAVKKVRPKFWLFENVRGLLYKNRWYLEEVIDALEGVGYKTDFQLLNAVNFGVPQNRERVIVVGHHGGFEYPVKQLSTVTAGAALGKLAAKATANAKFLTPNQDKYIAKYEKASKCIVPRDLHLDKPARTLTCRNLGGATGDMQRIRLKDGRRRRLTVREAARLQSFPDWFEFSGSEGSQFNQIGNAVPPLFAKALAQAVQKYLEGGVSKKPTDWRSTPLQRKLVLSQE